ncbi:MAG: APC family permease [Betaproteobacteria bacterium]|nr:APC family permease [Betaproteobacteria bacterium]
MSFLRSLRNVVIGKPLDPLNVKGREHLALAAFLAWVGLGADGLSSAAYGPQEAFLALGANSDLGLYLALATAVTVFIIALAYNQVIELFPTGGGGYRVTTSLLGPYAGLVAGAALIVDYVLTIAISVASGIDQLFSLLPSPEKAAPYKLWVEIPVVLGLLVLNLRGMKESIKILLPIFLGFVITHLALIIYGIAVHAGDLPNVIARTSAATASLTAQVGIIGAISAMLLAYAQGGGTYTGIEAVSNNVNSLAEPRVQTGKRTMLYMALSLAIAAGGILLLYLLWQVKHVEGTTLNAVLFGSIIADFGIRDPYVNWMLLTIVLVLEAGLLFVAANTGFLGGPSVLYNMAADSWVPHKFRYLSTRLVTKNGIIMMGLAALLILYGTKGETTLLVVLYSISVFLTFALSLFGLCRYWFIHRGESHWFRRLLLSLVGSVICAVILVMLIINNFTAGGWATLFIIGGIVAVCIYIRHHYDDTKVQLRKIDAIFAAQPMGPQDCEPALLPDAPTAVFLVGSSKGGGIHTLLWVQRMFPDHFKNFVFINARTVDVRSYGGAEALEAAKKSAQETLDYFVNFCHSYGLAAKSYLAFGTDPVADYTHLSEKVAGDFSNCIFFASKLVFQDENWFTRLLHNQAALALQRRFHFKNMQLVILPMKL